MKLRRSHSSKSVSEKPKIRISDPIPISSSVLSSITDPVLENIRDSRSNITEDPGNDVFSSKFNEDVECYEYEDPDIIPLEVTHPIEGSVSPENADNKESEGSGVSEDSNYEVMSDVPLTTSHEAVAGPETEPLPEPIEDPSTAALCTLPAGSQDMTTEEKSPKSPPAPEPSFSPSYSSPCTCTAFKAEIDNIKVQMKGLAKENRELKLEINKIYSILCQKDQNSDPVSSTLVKCVINVLNMRTSDVIPTSHF